MRLKPLSAVCTVNAVAATDIIIVVLAKERHLQYNYSSVVETDSKLKYVRVYYLLMYFLASVSPLLFCARTLLWSVELATVVVVLFHAMYNIILSISFSLNLDFTYDSRFQVVCVLRTNIIIRSLA